MRIYLVGFMGSGKTTLGRIAAAHYHVPFVDTDAAIEEQEAMSVADIFIDKGEYFFRDLEYDIIRSTSKMDKAIIATGGGLPCFGNNMEWMLEHGITIYLQWPVEKLKANLLAQRQDRPLLSSIELDKADKKMDELLTLRTPVYEQAAVTIEMSGVEEEDLQKLIQACRYIW